MIEKMDPIEFVQLIESAFPVEPVPDADQLADGPLYPGEEENLIKIFGGKRWTDISPTDCRYGSDALNFMAVPAFRYYLPAFLKAAVIDPDEADMGAMKLIYIAGSDDRLVSIKRQRDSLGSLTAMQRRAYLMTLRCLQGGDEDTKDEAQKAIEYLTQFWHME